MIYALTETKRKYYKTIYDYYKKMYYKNNVTIMGSPSFTDGVVEGFSKNDFLLLPNNLSPTNGFEIQLKVKAPSKVYTQEQGILTPSTSGVNAVLVTIRKEEQAFRADISTDGSSWFSGINFSFDFEQWYWLKVIYDNTASVFSFHVSTDGENFSEVDNYTISSPSWSNVMLQLGGWRSNSRPFKGQIDLSECYIKIDSVIWWSGVLETASSTADWERDECVAEAVTSYDGEYTSRVAVGKIEATADDYDSYEDVQAHKLYALTGRYVLKGSDGDG